MDLITLLTVVAALVTVISGVVGGWRAIEEILSRRRARLGTTPPRSIPADAPPRPHSLTMPHGNRRWLLRWAGASVLGVIAAAIVYELRQGQRSSNAPPLTIDVLCSTEKEQWMTLATDAFHRSQPQLNGRAVRINVLLRGSVDASTSILAGTLTPAAWTPASTVELHQLSAAWEAQHPNVPPILLGSDMPSLVSSPLVLGIWQSRAKLLQQHFGAITWQSAYAALGLTNGWAAIAGGSSNWGLVKFGQTRPDLSNSGLLTIILILEDYATRIRGGALTTDTLADPAARTYLRTFEDAVTGFGNSSGTYLQNCAVHYGSAFADIVATYENLLLTQPTQVPDGDQLLRFYPDHTLVSDHPFAIIQSSTITAEMHQAAQMFRDFLLAVPQQHLAIQQGFRPGNTSVEIGDGSIANNPFATAQPPAPATAALHLGVLPDNSLVTGIIQLWQTNYQDTTVAPGC